MLSERSTIWASSPCHINMINVRIHSLVGTQIKWMKTECKNDTSPAGNRTPVSRVTGGDTYHYTTEDVYFEYDQNFYFQTCLSPSSHWLQSSQISAWHHRLWLVDVFNSSHVLFVFTTLRLSTFSSFLFARLVLPSPSMLYVNRGRQTCKSTLCTSVFIGYLQIRLNWKYSMDSVR